MTSTYIRGLNYIVTGDSPYSLSRPVSRSLGTSFPSFTCFALSSKSFLPVERISLTASLLFFR